MSTDAAGCKIRDCFRVKAMTALFAHSRRTMFEKTNLIPILEQVLKLPKSNNHYLAILAVTSVCILVFV